MTTLPDPTSFDADGTPWWRLADGERVYALDGAVYGPTGSAPLEIIEANALAQLAAVAWARGEIGGAA